MYFRSCCRSCAILAPRGSPKCSKTAPRLDFLVFSTILGAILNRFFIIFHLHLDRISKSISPSMFDFLVQFLLSLSSSSLKFWHGGGLLRAAPWIWWSYMMIMYDDHIWWSYMMIKCDDHILWSYMMILYLKNSKFNVVSEMFGELREMCWNHHWCITNYLDPLTINFFSTN